MSTRAYLDWNATAPVRPAAAAAVAAALAQAGNPSSIHREGRGARARLERARAEVARLAAAHADEVVFTSGGTEANMLALHRVCAAAPVTGILVSAVEHDALLAAAESAGPPVRRVPVEPDGRLDLAALREELAAPGGLRLVSVMAANNETGVVQPLAEIAGLCAASGAILHTDAVQVPGRLPPEALAPAALVSLSAHKIGGPQGAGAVIVRAGTPFAAVRAGGGQEQGRRPGTENAPGIAGFGAAAADLRADPDAAARMARLRDRLEREALARVPGLVIPGAAAPRLPNTSCLAVPGIAAATQVIACDLGGVAVSAGSACTSGKLRPSHVLTAMGLPPAVTQSAIRVSLGPDTTDAEITCFLDVWIAHVERARALAGPAPAET